ncbi:MAG: hypothetical protein AABX84_00655 [Nanoarchaeota archaeon]
MKNLKYELITAESDPNLRLKLEEFERKHPNANIKSSTHSILTEQKKGFPSEEITHYYILWYRES